MGYEGFRVLLHLRLGIILSLLAGITYCKHAPASFSELFGSHKYITEAYFQKHNTLIDRAFQDFISSELSHVICRKQNLMPQLLVMQRQLIGEGSHRRLTSSVKIEIQPEVISPLSCEAIVIERLPSGVFADPFELEHLTGRGVFSGASAFGDTDLELPTVRANRSVVEVHEDLSPNSLSGNKNIWELNIEIPLHARYAPLGNTVTQELNLSLPTCLYIALLKGTHLTKAVYFHQVMRVLECVHLLLFGKYLLEL